MSAFNSSFYQSNRKYNISDAEQRLLSLGFSDFSFKGVSYTNGCSFYFTSNEGKEIRVSDHLLTGKRAFDTMQVSIVDVKKLAPITKTLDLDFQARLAAAIAAKK